MRTIQDLAAATAADIREHGWVKGSYMDLHDDELTPENCPVCVWGGMNRAMGGTPDHEPTVYVDDYRPTYEDILDGENAKHYTAEYKLWQELDDKIASRTGTTNAADFNDYDETTEEDVIRLLDSIANS